MLFNNILEAVGHTPLVRLANIASGSGVTIFAKLEGQNLGGSASLKDRIANYMIQRAEESGELTPGKTILEATSGNTGIALAMVGHRKGYKVKIVMPDNMSLERRQLLELYGAEIILTEGAKGMNGAIEVAEELAAKNRSYFMPDQFSNPANPLAHYETTGAEILECLPGVSIDVFIAGIGTGGTITGVGRRLREHHPRVKIIGVEAPLTDTIQGLRNLEDFIPPVLDLSLVDERVVVTSRDANKATRDLLQKEGIFAGPSSGAVAHEAIRLAGEMEKGVIIVLLPDGGWKYLSMDLWASER